MMKNPVYYILFVSVFLAQTLFGQEQIKPKMSWDGYAQLRFKSNFQDVNSFAMRRMKLWLYSTPDFNAHWGYKVQTTITSNQNEKFVLQDVEAFYRFKHFKINFGQFIPHYSLQRFQPDYVVPLTERAPVINELIPNGTLGVRDIGIEANFLNSEKNFETWIGVFNGSGIKEYRLDNSGFMITHKTIFHFFHTKLNAGYSLMYRKADQLQLLGVLPDSVLFSGNDFRFNVFAQFQLEKFQVQAEYLRASLEGQMAEGYYVLVLLNLGKSQVVASWNQYTDLIQSTDNAPQIHFGYNYLINNNKLKLMLDNSAQLRDGQLCNFFSTIQFQIFFR